MAFTYTIKKVGVIGDQRYVEGTFASAGGSTGGDIVTGLNQVYHIELQHTGTAVVASAPVVNETMPCNSTVTIVTVADTAGTFYAVGY